MASYDSDSSDEEYTETNVLLGYASKDAAPGEDATSLLGGRPDWLDPQTPPSAALARCKVCKDLMVQLLQLNGELPEKFPGHDRRIHVFACRRASCRRREGSIRTLRAVRVWKDEVARAEQEKQKEKLKEEKKQSNGPGLGDTLFGGKGPGSGSGPANPFSSGANPFGSSSAGASSNPFSPSAPKTPEPKDTTSSDVATSLPKTFAETLNLNAPPQEAPPPPEPWPEESSQPQAYPTLYLTEADYETLDPTPAASIPANTRMEDADAPEPSALDREAFESSMDATFQKFADRIAQNPDQVIRYEFGGVPLLYAKNDPVGVRFAQQHGISTGGVPGCGNCGAKRTFEVQLMPNAIAELEADDMSLEGMEWGTIIVCVCERDCVAVGTGDGEVGYREEWAGVQWEELAKRK